MTSSSSKKNEIDFMDMLLPCQKVRDPEDSWAMQLNDSDLWLLISFHLYIHIIYII